MSSLKISIGMEKYGIKNPKANLAEIGIHKVKKAHWNLTPELLIEQSLSKGFGVLADNGALVVQTGAFTGRAPKDRFIVKDSHTKDLVDWGEVNQPFDPDAFDMLEQELTNYFGDKEVFVHDAFAGVSETHRLKLRLVAEYPWSAHFAHNMFLRPTAEELACFEPEWTILAAPGYFATPKAHQTRQHNFAIINFTKQKIIIGGTGYTGEIKKGIFSVLNFLWPHQYGVLAMHCSANVGEKGDTAIFFGLSGTGKTTLSADPHRRLIGDDEHGWSNEGIFNFEGGCYAKCFGLKEAQEPEIYQAIKHRAILENIKFFPGTRSPNYEDASITENTRVSYPIHHIENAVIPSFGGHPNHIFFLTCDAFGVLPPIAKLTPAQAMYYFISGYTAKVAGTEAGIDEPQATFSACFGAPFMPLHPTIYAELLRSKMEQHQTTIWLVNTGWVGGPYGTGSRIKLKYTRALIRAAMEGTLEKSPFETHPILYLKMPMICPGVPFEILNPKTSWADKSAYDNKAYHLAELFRNNFKQFEAKASESLLAAAPGLVLSILH